MYDTVEHKDCLGRTLKVGDCVAVSHHNKLMIATVGKLNAKMLSVTRVDGKKSGKYKKYSSECALLQGPEVTMFLLNVNSTK